jgi:hypothetical protein
MTNARRRLLWPVLLALLFTAQVGAAPAEEATRPDSLRRLNRDGRQLELLIDASVPGPTRDKLTAWIEFIAEALGRVFGHWPRQRWQIAITPASGSVDDPIPWAQVQRGDVDRVEFFTVTSSSFDTLKSAWTGYHELAHLLIPYRGWGDAWFSEGLASYYQNILRFRAGVISEQQLWQKLHDGFQRGLADARFDGQPLSAVSAGLRKQGGFMRVYWSGAWYFLVADTRLRLQSGGSQGLDQALATLNRCCANRQLSVVEMVDLLDELNRLVLFRPLYEEMSRSTRVPGYVDIFASMGIDIVEGKVRLQQQGPGATLRRQLASGQTL